MEQLLKYCFQILGISFLALLISCGNGSEAGSSSKDNSTKENASAEKADGDDVSNNPVYKKGLGLIAKSDCLTCHKVDEKLVGPSYREVAEKYAEAPNDVVTALADKIIKGGVGNWGNVPMLPHPAISQEDAETMVRYILLLKK
ncbi:MAG: c-type cytochrome [Chitinophagaceae bacterium]